jgi:hypothetical protein
MTLIVTSSLLCTNVAAANTASFRDFVSRVTDMFELGGWVNTNCFNTINTASVQPPSGSGSIMGLQVWRFNDWWHNSGSAPVFVRVEYGNTTNDGTARSCGIFLSAGFTHDNSGNVGPADGIDRTVRQSGLAYTANTAASGTFYTHRTCIISGGDASIILYNDLATVMSPAFIERTKDVNGNPTNEGIILGTYNVGAVGARQQSLLYSQSAGQPPVIETYWNHIASGRNGSAYATNLAISMVIPMLKYGYGYPSRMMGFIRADDLPNNTLHTISMFGTSSTYFVSSNTSVNTSTVTGRNSVGAYRLIARNE